MINNFLLISLVMVQIHALDKFIPLYGNATEGNYYVNIDVGNPPQKQALMIDTSSPLSIITCAMSINGVQKFYPLFNMIKSSTVRRLNPGENFYHWKMPEAVCRDGEHECFITASLTDGSTSEGMFYTDVFSFENMDESSFNKQNHIFLCSQSSTGVFQRRDVNGLLGLNISPQEIEFPPSVLETNFLAGASSKKLVSVCLAHDGGYIRFRQSLSVDFVTQRQTINIKRKKSANINSLIVKVTNVKIEGKELITNKDSKINTNNYRTHINSGAPTVKMPQIVYNNFAKKIYEACVKNVPDCKKIIYPQALAICFNFSRIENLEKFMRSFPDITFTLNNQAQYVWTPQDYFHKIGNYITIPVVSSDVFLLGAPFMKNHEITFDYSARRISFERANCTVLTNRQ